jgi:hypothetical protein
VWINLGLTMQDPLQGVRTAFGAKVSVLLSLPLQGVRTAFGAKVSELLPHMGVF